MERNKYEQEKQTCGQGRVESPGSIKILGEVGSHEFIMKPEIPLR